MLGTRFLFQILLALYYLGVLAAKVTGHRMFGENL